MEGRLFTDHLLDDRYDLMSRYEWLLKKLEEPFDFVIHRDDLRRIGRYFCDPYLDIDTVNYRIRYSMHILLIEGGVINLESGSYAYRMVVSNAHRGYGPYMVAKYFCDKIKASVMCWFCDSLHINYRTVIARRTVDHLCLDGLINIFHYNDDGFGKHYVLCHMIRYGWLDSIKYLTDDEETCKLVVELVSYKRIRDALIWAIYDLEEWLSCQDWLEEKEPPMFRVYRELVEWLHSKELLMEADYRYYYSVFPELYAIRRRQIADGEYCLGKTRFDELNAERIRKCLDGDEKREWEL
jgi:hypothetical protein